MSVTCVREVCSGAAYATFTLRFQLHCAILARQAATFKPRIPKITRLVGARFLACHSQGNGPYLRTALRC